MAEPFRILDLGAHDGFVTNFIARQARNSGVELHVDGVEANPDAVRIFNERLVRDGLAGECRQGLAEHAPALFELYSYDAVVMYEIIEHAPVVEKLLNSAEMMLKDDGRIYVSTPNGTFGAGHNPHHLRVWSITQLVDLLRRRGYIHDCEPGADGVSVVSYMPVRGGQPQMEVAIYTGPGWEPWHPFDIERKGLGGSETAAIRLAESLSKNYGCRVTVYGEVNPGAVGQVLYLHHETFDPMERRDLVICSRVPELFDRKINAAAKLLWMHDTDRGPALTEKRAEQVDRVMCLSHWHYGHLLQMYPFLNDKITITRNGIEPSYFAMPEDNERNIHRAIYTSSPDRGLDLLLEWWPEVRKRVPDAELAYAYATVYDAVATKDPRIRAFRDTIRLLSDQEGVVNLGSLTQPGVAKEMMKSGVWLAPSYSTPAGMQFFETFCIGAVEAAAAGCHRVMSQWGALEERDETPYNCSRWIPADDDGKPQKHAWIGAIIKAMTEGEDHRQSITALDMDWDEVAADMLAAADIPSKTCHTPQYQT